MDKKYREKLPSIIKEIPASAFSDDENHSAAALPGPKKRKTKKLKPSKDGMFPSEEEYIKRWWTTDDPGSPRDRTQTGEVVIKRKAAELRIRETLAQLILILEILALEASPSYQPPEPDNVSIDLESQVAVDGVGPSMKRKKPRKPQDFSLLIDLLVDKLCIWQSIEHDDNNSLQETHSATVAKDSDATAGKSGSSDRLKSFCVEVIIPFYMTRLPEQAKSINEKLGGPSAPPPLKRTISATQKTSSKPGEPQARARPIKKPRSLARISTDTATQTTHHPPSLSRSATDSLVPPNLKREASETPLSAIPIKLDRTGSLSRSSSSTFKRFSQREVDLSAMTTANEAKLRKKATIEEELRNAISTLKKPNRGMAVREYVEATDQRRKRPSLQSRKSSNGVQVTATPKRAKKTNEAVHATPVPKMPMLAPQAPPSSSASCIPSSAVRPTVSVATRPPNGRVNSTHSAVQETPSRGPSKFVSLAAEPAASLAFPAAAGREAGDDGDGVAATVLGTPSKDRGRDARVLATPTKARGGFAVAAGGGIRLGLEGKEEVLEGREGVDIYDALGWEDDVDEFV